MMTTALRLFFLVALSCTLGGCAIPRLAIEQARWYEVASPPSDAPVDPLNAEAFAYSGGAWVHATFYLPGNILEVREQLTTKLEQRGWKRDPAPADVQDDDPHFYYGSRQDRWWGTETVFIRILQEYRTDGRESVSVFVSLHGNYLYSRELGEFKDHMVLMMMAGGPIVGTILYIPNIILLALF